MTACAACGQPTGIVASLPGLIGKVASMLPAVGPIAGPLVEILAREILSLAAGGDEPARLAPLPDTAAALEAAEKEIARS